MLFFVPFASFFVVSSLQLPLSFQSSIILTLLLITIFRILKQKCELPTESVPYILMPLWLFASINMQLEFATEDMIFCMSMLLATLIIFTQKENFSQHLLKGILVAAGMHLSLQGLGIIIEEKKMTISTVFPMANEIMFFYMIAMFSAIIVYKTNNNQRWKKFAIAIGLLTFLSLSLGETIHNQIFKLSGEDALGIWLGLGCGTLFTGTLMLWKKFNLPTKIGLPLAGLIFLIQISVSIIVVNVDIFGSKLPSEVSSRLDNWIAGFNIVKENPMGVGFGAYGANVMQNWPALEDGYRSLCSSIVSSAHNQWLQILTELGWLGWLFYSALFAMPWLVSVYRYLKTGQPQFLFISGTLAAICSVMVVAEAISLFALMQIMHWMFLCYCAKYLMPLPFFPQKKIIIQTSICRIFAIIFAVLTLILLYDRGKQIYSMHLMTWKTTEEAIPVDRALAIYPKNLDALGLAWTLHLNNGNYEQAFKALEAIEEISGYFWPLHQARAETYYEMGDLEKACEMAKFPINHYQDAWTKALKKKLKCEER